MRRPDICAHRLGRAYGPDSSRQALAASLDADADALETDVCLTADERLVLLHDPLLELGTTGSGWVSDATAARISDLRLLDREGRPTSEAPLRLEELLELAPERIPIQVEVKSHANRVLARRTAAVLCERFRAHRDRLEVTSFHSAACEVAAACGFAARLVIHADYAPEALIDWARRHHVAGVSVEHFLLSRELARALRFGGLSVSVGTINDEAILKRAIELAAPDMVVTDRPAAMSAALAEPPLRAAARRAA